VYKNPKKSKVNVNGVGTGTGAGKAKGASAMQPAASGMDGVAVKLMKGETGDVEGRMNEDAFLRLRAEDVPVDQVCFCLLGFSGRV
jgi:Nucleic-acid-binding protein possibly involved in ribosomal biogenesis